MLELHLVAESEADLALALPFLRERDRWKFDSTAAMTLIGPLVVSDAVLDEKENVLTAAVIDGRFHANLRCTEAVAAKVPPEIIVNPKTPRVSWALGPSQILEVPETITDRQFWQQLAVLKVIEEKEALAAVTNKMLPVLVQVFIEGLDPKHQFNARMFFSSTVFKRKHLLVGAFFLALNWSEAQIDQMWVEAAAL